MTGYTLIQTVDYEGSQLIGMFSSIEDIIEFLKGHRSYTEDVQALAEGREIEIEHCENRQNAWNAPVSSTGCWTIEGTYDSTFVIYSFAL